MCVGKYRKKSTGYKRSSVINDYHIQYVVGCFNIDAKGLLCTRTRVLTHTNVQLLLVCVCVSFFSHSLVHILRVLSCKEERHNLRVAGLYSAEEKKNRRK